MENKKVLDKICKCLRLAESGNPHEAAMAMRQAQGLMKKYNIREDQVLAATVSETIKSVASGTNPPFWVLALSNMVADAFACQAFVARRSGQASRFHFIGMGYAPEVAGYTFSVLHRQLKRARQEYVQNLDIDSKSEKTRRGNVFAQAWLYRAARTVAEFSDKAEGKAAIDAYIREQYGALGSFARAPALTDLGDHEVVLSGMRAADGVTLYKPMHQQDPAPRLSR
ncbi:MAG: DUF2786 domain-containing protein [Gammaproteobacteria bacterium]